MLILGIDGGFANLGMAIVEIKAERAVVTNVAIIRTKKNKDKKAKASEDNVERGTIIVKALVEVLEKYPVKAFAVEAMSFPRSSSVAAKLALVWGILIALSVRYSIPILQVTPKALKKAVTGDESAEKDAVLNAVRSAVGNIPGLDVIPKSLWEHPSDAVAAVLACRDRIITIEDT